MFLTSVIHFCTFIKAYESFQRKKLSSTGQIHALILLFYLISIRVDCNVLLSVCCTAKNKKPQQL